MFKNGSIPWFQLFKYAIYILLGINCVQYFLQDYRASLISNGLGLAAFSASVDTFMWLVLLITFELETYVLDDYVVRKFKWLFKTLFFICYMILIYTFYGYMSKYIWTLDFSPVTGGDPVKDFIGYSWLQELDEFIRITQDNAEILTASTDLLINKHDHILTDGSALNYTRYQALADVFNAAAWLFIVCILEIDVWLKLKNRFKGVIKTVSGFLKIAGYAVLLAAAVFWAYNGLLLDFWDAFLWIVAFVFIEMNLIQWKPKPETLAPG